MAATEGPSGSLVSAGRTQSFADMVAQSPQPLSMVEVPFQLTKIIASEYCVIFSKEEVDQLATPFKYSMVMKFIRKRPMLDVIRYFIRSRWGLEFQPVVSAMRRLRKVFVHLQNEADFLKALLREVTNIDGVSYRGFHQTLSFGEDKEPSMIPVWIVLPGLHPNLQTLQTSKPLMMGLRCVLRWMQQKSHYVGSGLEFLIR